MSALHRTERGYRFSSIKPLCEYSADCWEHGPGTLSIGVCGSKQEEVLATDEGRVVDDNSRYVQKEKLIYHDTRKKFSYVVSNIIYPIGRG